MKPILLPALAALAASAFAPAASASDSVRAMKGHLPIPAAAESGKSAKSAVRVAPAACHPDPGKGRACRHVAAKAEEARRDAPAFAEASVPQPGSAE